MPLSLPDLRSAMDAAIARHDPDGLLSLVAEISENDGYDAWTAVLHARATAHRLRGDYPKALQAFQEQLALFQQQNDTNRIATTLVTIGLITGILGDYPEALRYANESLQILEGLGDRGGMAMAYNSAGTAHLHLGDNNAALSNFNHVLKICSELNDHAGMAAAFGNMALVHHNFGDLPSVLRFLHRAVDEYQHANMPLGVARTFDNMGMIYLSINEYDRALDYCQRALDRFIELGDMQQAAVVYSNVALAYIGLEDFGSARIVLERGLAECERLSIGPGVQISLVNLGNLYVTLQEFDRAEFILQRLHTERLTDPHPRFYYLKLQGALAEHRHDYDEALQHYQTALQESIFFLLREIEAEAHRLLRDLAFKRKDLDAYVEHSKQHIAITESIKGKDASVKLAVAEVERDIHLEREQHQRYLAVLHSTLPSHVADRVAKGESVTDEYDNAVVIFSDIAGFTTNSSQLKASAVVDFLQAIFSHFDTLSQHHGVTKIKTMGDGYMAVVFPDAESSTSDSTSTHVRRACEMAYDMITHSFVWPHNGEAVAVRIGMHMGPLVAGVLGTVRLQYDVWGDTVNVASRMESTSEPGRIQVSDAFAHSFGLATGDGNLQSVQDTSAFFSLIPRGGVQIKGKGLMETYWLERVPVAHTT